MSDWYKMNPIDWNSGTDGLTLEQEAAYLRLCHAMYISEGPIKDNNFVLCGLFRCNDRKAKRLLFELISAGKILVENGLISNRRALEVISDRRRVAVERKSAGIRGGLESGKSRSKSLLNKETDKPIASVQNEPDKIRIDKINNTPSLRSGVAREDSKFSEFWKLYPSKVGKGAAEAAFSKAIKLVGFEEMMIGLRLYVNKTDDRQWCNPATWLNQKRWADAPSVVHPKSRETEFSRQQRSFTDALEAQVYGDRDDREFTRRNSDIELGPRDFSNFRTA